MSRYAAPDPSKGEFTPVSRTPRTGSRTLSQQIAADLTHRIAAGEFTVGDYLPPRTALQTHYAHLSAAGKVSANTLAAAQDILTSEGLVTSDKPRGVRIIATPTPDTYPTLSGGPAVITLTTPLPADTITTHFPPAGDTAYGYLTHHPHHRVTALAGEFEETATISADRRDRYWAPARRALDALLEHAADPDTITTLHVPHPGTLDITDTWVTATVPITRIATTTTDLTPDTYRADRERFLAARRLTLTLPAAAVTTISR